MVKFYFAFAWDIIVNLHVCICKNKICIWSDPGVNLPICKYTPVCICVRMRHLLTPSKICTPEYIYTCVFLAHANWTLVLLLIINSYYVFHIENHTDDPIFFARKFEAIVNQEIYNLIDRNLRKIHTGMLEFRFVFS